MILYEYTGIVKKNHPTEILKNDFKKRKLVLTDDLDVQTKFPNTLCFIFKQDRTSLPDLAKEGSRVKVTFCIDGREWEGRYYTDLVAMKLEVLGQTETAAEPPAEEPEEHAAVNADDPDSDIPF